MNSKIKKLVDDLKKEIASVKNVDDKIDLLNEVRLEIHEVSPLKHHPVDCVVWEKSKDVEVQRVNPNSVAPDELRLLYESVSNDGYTMPCPSYKQPDGIVRIVDGYHRRKIERTFSDISDSTLKRIPVSLIRKSQEDESNRVASTIRHNRARGSHNIEIMSTIVQELVEMGKGDPWICKHIGMSQDELLRMKQITGLASLFLNKDFSEAWEADNENNN